MIVSLANVCWDFCSAGQLVWWNTGGAPLDSLRKTLLPPLRMASSASLAPKVDTVVKASVKARRSAFATMAVNWSKYYWEKYPYPLFGSLQCSEGRLAPGFDNGQKDPAAHHTTGMFSWVHSVRTNNGIPNRPLFSKEGKGHSLGWGQACPGY